MVALCGALLRGLCFFPSRYWPEFVHAGWVSAGWALEEQPLLARSPSSLWHLPPRLVISLLLTAPALARGITPSCSNLRDLSLSFLHPSVSWPPRLQNHLGPPGASPLGPTWRAWFLLIPVFCYSPGPLWWGLRLPLWALWHGLLSIWNASSSLLSPLKSCLSF